MARQAVIVVIIIIFSEMPLPHDRVQTLKVGEELLSKVSVSKLLLWVDENDIP